MRAMRRISGEAVSLLCDMGLLIGPGEAYWFPSLTRAKALDQPKRAMLA